jgi:hypothetical protein
LREKIYELKQIGKIFFMVEENSFAENSQTFVRGMKNV